MHRVHRHRHFLCRRSGNHHHFHSDCRHHQLQQDSHLSHQIHEQIPNADQWSHLGHLHHQNHNHDHHHSQFGQEHGSDRDHRRPSLNHLGHYCLFGSSHVLVADVL